ILIKNVAQQNSEAPRQLRVTKLLLRDILRGTPNPLVLARKEPRFPFPLKRDTPGSSSSPRLFLRTMFH
ncbi:hypothetical protein HAX54_053316, partial [Datura stramonium]|nr:hypothetical protein [Datura stramonium]